jgi:hypothetical protein
MKLDAYGINLVIPTHIYAAIHTILLTPNICIPCYLFNLFDDFRHTSIYNGTKQTYEGKGNAIGKFRGIGFSDTYREAGKAEKDTSKEVVDNDDKASDDSDTLPKKPSKKPAKKPPKKPPKKSPKRIVGTDDESSDDGDGNSDDNRSHK